MNATKKINVNFSSLVGLKAELLRKQTEVNEAKLRTETARPIPKIKKKTKRSTERTTDDRSKEMVDVDDINAHKKSKLMLEAKARLYERLKKSKNRNENFLVDFTNKSDESEEEKIPEEPEDSYMDDNEDDWVEYQDCFGRTRKCLREDLPVMQEKDDFIKHQIMNRRREEPRHREILKETPIIEEKEPEIEIMRRKWEEQTEKLADKVNIHYQDVLFDEARAHGVGYYAFAQDEEQRAKQQENLANLRKDTERKQKEMKDLKELRDRMEQNRLKAARIRQRIRAGLPAEPTEEELAQQNSDTYNLNTTESTDNAHIVQKDIIKESEEKQENVKQSEEKQENVKESESLENKEVIQENKIKALGELLGKKTPWYEMSQEEWVYKCRNTRVNEFGPVYDNFKSAGYLTPEEQTTQLLNDKDENVINDQTVETNANVENIYQSSYSDTIHEQASLIQNSNSNVTNDTSSFVENVSVADPDLFSHIQLPCDTKSVSTENVQDNTEKNTILPDTAQSAAVKKSLNEESIVAGLRYLREKFEKSHNM